MIGLEILKKRRSQGCSLVCRDSVVSDASIQHGDKGVPLCAWDSAARCLLRCVNRFRGFAQKKIRVSGLPAPVLSRHDFRPVCCAAERLVRMEKEPGGNNEARYSSQTGPLVAKRDRGVGRAQ